LGVSLLLIFSPFRNFSLFLVKGYTKALIAEPSAEPSTEPIAEPSAESRCWHVRVCVIFDVGAHVRVRVWQVCAERLVCVVYWLWVCVFEWRVRVRGVCADCRCAFAWCACWLVGVCTRDGFCELESVCARACVREYRLPMLVCVWWFYYW